MNALQSISHHLFAAAAAAEEQPPRRSSSKTPSPPAAKGLATAIPLELLTAAEEALPSATRPLRTAVLHADS